ncbi:hypothetical protein CC78DRAFT_618568, partial [Lojkania enalia]
MNKMALSHVCNPSPVPPAQDEQTAAADALMQLRRQTAAEGLLILGHERVFQETKARWVVMQMDFRVRGASPGSVDNGETVAAKMEEETEIEKTVEGLREAYKKGKGKEKVSVPAKRVALSSKRMAKASENKKAMPPPHARLKALGRRDSGFANCRNGKSACVTTSSSGRGKKGGNLSPPEPPLYIEDEQIILRPDSPAFAEPAPGTQIPVQNSTGRLETPLPTPPLLLPCEKFVKETEATVEEVDRRISMERNGEVRTGPVDRRIDEEDADEGLGKGKRVGKRTGGQVRGEGQGGVDEAFKGREEGIGVV